MRTSKFSLYTLRKTVDYDLISHKLMIQSGMINQLSSGIYIWLPIGMRIIKKIKNLILNYINKINCIEILLPIIHPIYFWYKSGRLIKYGKELFILKNNKYILSPTNEEIIAYLINKIINSYKNFPIIFYQIQNKFRNEIRPYGGIIKTYEFIMKDAYSFHLEKKNLDITYEKFFYIYKKILIDLKLKYEILPCFNGKMGGNFSHEFYVYKNIYLNKYKFIIKYKNKIIIFLKKHIKIYNILYKNIIKYKFILTKLNNNFIIIGIIIRKNNIISMEKISKIKIINKNKKIINKDKLFLYFNYKNNFSLLNIPILKILDNNISDINKYFILINNNYIIINIYFNLNIISFIKYNCIKENIKLKTNIKSINKSINNNMIEIGHIFKLGNIYNNIFNCKKNFLMGCYGLGINRLIAGIIEQNNDKNGILWPKAITPFKLAIIPINLYKSSIVRIFTEDIYNFLYMYNKDILLDDRNLNFSVLYKDILLIGIPNILIINEKNILKNEIEYINRYNKYKKIISIKDIYILKKEIFN